MTPIGASDIRGLHERQQVSEKFAMQTGHHIKRAGMTRGLAYDAALDECHCIDDVAVLGHWHSSNQPPVQAVFVSSPSRKLTGYELRTIKETAARRAQCAVVRSGDKVERASMQELGAEGIATADRQIFVECGKYAC